MDPIKVPFTEDGYPKPTPPETKKADIFDPKDFAHVDQKARAAPTDLVKSYEELIKYLTKGLTSDLAKVRAVFVWLAEQKVVTSTYPKVVTERTPQAFLKKIKHDRMQFSDLFAYLCRKAGVPCVIIEGSSKGAGYEVGQSELKVTNRWNAVYVQDSWRLINVPWALVKTDGLEEGDRWMLVEEGGEAVREWEKAEKEVKEDTDEFWFLTDPRDFNCFLHAKKPQWQLLAEPWTDEQYHCVPKFEKDYFTSEWELISEYSSVLKAEGGRVQIRFAHPPETNAAYLQYKLFFCPALSKATLPDDLQLDRYVLENSKIGQKALLTRLPVEGVYRVQVAGQLDETIAILGEFRIDCVKVQKRVQKRPAPFPISNTPIGPTEEAREVVDKFSQEEGVVTAKQGERVEMKFGFKARKVRFRPKLLHNNRRPEELEQYIQCNTDKNDVNISVTMPVTDNKDDEYALSVDATATVTDENGKDVITEYPELINYLLTADNNMTFPKDREGIQAKTDLLEALKGFNIDTLKNCMARAEQSGVLDPLNRDKATSYLVYLNKIKGEKLRELHHAIKGGDVSELEAALAECQKIGSLEPSLVKETAVVLELLKAMKDDDDVDKLEKALREAQKVKLDISGQIQRATDRLLNHYDKGLTEACNKRDVEELTEFVKSVEKSCVAGHLKSNAGHSYQKAVKLITHLKEVKRVTNEVSKMTARDLKVVSDSRSKTPHPHVHSVMMATFILLGEKEGDLWNWETVQNLVERRKESGVVKAMAEVDVNRLTSKQIELAESHVRACQLDVVKTECGKTPAVFLEWVFLTIEEWHGRQAVRRNTSQISNPGN